MSDLIGSTIVADFGDDGFFGGKIDNFDSDKGHHIVYEDGDGEWIKEIHSEFEFVQFNECNRVVNGRFVLKNMIHF